MEINTVEADTDTITSLVRIDSSSITIIIRSYAYRRWILILKANRPSFKYAFFSTFIIQNRPNNATVTVLLNIIFTIERCTIFFYLLDWKKWLANERLVCLIFLHLHSTHTYYTNICLLHNISNMYDTTDKYAREEIKCNKKI